MSTYISSEREFLQTDSPSVAVIPFIDLDDDCKQQQAGNWLATDIVHGLSKFRQLDVMGTQFAFVFREDKESLDQIRRSLGTRYLACGRVLRTVQHMEVEIRLIEAASGQVLWRNIFRTASTGLIGIEEDLAHTIASCLAIKIEAIERARFNDHVDAGGSNIAGLTFMASHLVKQMEQSANQRAQHLVQEALRISPPSAHAHAILSRTRHFDWRFAWVEDPDKAMEQAIDTAELAIDLDPMEASGYAALGISRLHNREHDAAVAACQHALRLNPHDPDIMADLGLCLIHNEDPMSAVELLALAIHLKPENADVYRLYLANAFGVLGDYHSVIETVLAMKDKFEGHRLLVASYAHLDMMEQAKRHAGEVLAVLPNFTLDHWRKVVPSKDRDCAEMFIEGLARGGLR